MQRLQVLVARLFLLGLAAGLIVAGTTIGARADILSVCASLSSFSAISDAMRLKDIDPMLVPSPTGVEPIAAPVEPIDTTAALDQAMTWKLRRTEATESGEITESMILPRRRPAPTTKVAAPKLSKPKVLAAASEAYRRFIADIRAISKMRLDDPKNLRRAQAMLKSYDDRRLARGWLALCAEIAVKSNDFVGGIKKAAGQKGGADDLKAELTLKPVTAFSFPGWENATRAIISEVARDTALMQSVADRLSEIAYGRTSKEASLAEAARRGDPNPDSPATAPTGSSLASASQLNSKAQAFIGQMLAVGARLYLSDRTTLGGDPEASAMAANRDNDQCLRWAKLNLSQCLAAAHDNNERAYCLGKQGIEERAKCWSWLLHSGA